MELPRFTACARSWLISVPAALRVLALARSENGTFGICERCEDEISMKRLEARPVTTLCIDCKTLDELRERRAERRGGGALGAAGGGLDHELPGRRESGVGRFETETYVVPASLGGVAYSLRCGILPGRLGAALLKAAVEGIVGNAVVLDRTVGYFPRRETLIFETC